MNPQSPSTSSKPTLDLRRYTAVCRFVQRTVEEAAPVTRLKYVVALSIASTLPLYAAFPHKDYASTGTKNGDGVLVLMWLAVAVVWIVLVIKMGVMCVEDIFRDYNVVY